jgi:hypothetical protein
MTPRLTVTLLVNSGEENPAWDMNAREISAFVELLKCKTPSDVTAPKPHTGYAGFLVVIVNKDDDHFPSTLRVESGLLWFLNDNNLKVFNDAGGVESFLQQQARNEGHGEYFEAVGGSERPV